MRLRFEAADIYLYFEYLPPLFGYDMLQIVGQENRNAVNALQITSSGFLLF